MSNADFFDIEMMTMISGRKPVLEYMRLLRIFRRYFTRGYMAHRVYYMSETGRLDVDFPTRILMMTISNIQIGTG